MFAQFASRASLGALLIGLGAAGCNSSPAVASRTSALGSASLTISKLYGAGGNTGATFNADFVELFNASSAPVDVAGWSVQYSSATGTSWFPAALNAELVPAGGYYLVQLSTGTVGTALTSPDTTNTTVNMSGTAGKLALVSNTTPLTCGATVGSCATAAGLVDFVGYGATAKDYETAAAPAPSATNVLVRNGGGSVDTDNNSADFTVVLGTTITINHGMPADMAQPVLDLTPPPDLLPPPDLQGADLSVPPDLATPPDLQGADLLPPPDLAIVPDMTVPVDMAKPNDLASDPSGAGTVVISQIYGSGGNTGATFTNDYIELFNPSKAAVSISNWSVQYGSAANAFSQVAVIPAGATIGAGQYYLIQVAGGTVGTALPTPDFAFTTSTSFNISATNGKIALVDNPTLLTCGTATTRCSSPSISDLIGFGTAADYEGMKAAPAPGGATKALFRAGGGCVDTGENSADIAPGTALPRNSATAAVDCSTVVLDMSAPGGDDAAAPGSPDLGHGSAGGGGSGGGSAGGTGGTGGGGTAGGSAGSGGTHSGGGGCAVAPNAPSDAGAPVVLMLAAIGFWLRRRARVRLG